MSPLRILLFVVFFFFTSSSYDGPLYNPAAYTECKSHPEYPLYDGGMLKDQPLSNPSSFFLKNLDNGTNYCFSIWIRIQDADSSPITASLATEETELTCIGTVIAKRGCWSFLKGGFVWSSPSNSSTVYIQSSNMDEGIEVASASLQPFTNEEWRFNQDAAIKEARKRAVTIHVSNQRGRALKGAGVRVEQLSKAFPFGSAIASSILGNSIYQRWFLERFNAAVFENELKWSTTEPVEGQLNYTCADQMLEFVRSNQMIVRGHNVFQESPKSNAEWIQNLTGLHLKSAVNARLRGVMQRYRGEFIHWDVSNEMLHSHFFEDRLGPNASLHFFRAAHQADPLATLFMNEFNVVEGCSDATSTVDAYVSRMRELQRGGVSMGGIGLQGHFGVPNPPLMRGVIDKLATLGLPIWLTEVDISNHIDNNTQAIYLEQVLREGFSHPAMEGIMLWTALREGSCYKMCLTDTNFTNLATGDVVDKLLKEWSSGVAQGHTDERGGYSFSAFLGDYSVTAEFGDKTVRSTFSLSRGRETKHVNIQL